MTAASPPSFTEPKHNADEEPLIGPFVVGVDAGGSSTRAVLLSVSGTVVGYGRGESGNPTSSGPELAGASIAGAVLRAIAHAGGSAPLPGAVIPGAIVHTAVAMAGASTRATDWLGETLADAGIGGAASVEADLAAIYLSGSLAPLGYAALSGTGAIAARMRDHAIEQVADGVGWLLGDDGSGFQLGWAAARAAAAALDGRAEWGPLVPLVLAEFGLTADSDGLDEHRRPETLAALITAVYAERPVRLARLAPLAFRAAALGDEGARRAVDSAAAGLVRTLEAVIGDADDERDAPTVLGGSVLASQPAMADAIRAALGAHGVTGEVLTVPDGVVGSAVLALERVGAPVDGATHARIRETLAGLG